MWFNLFPLSIQLFCTVKPTSNYIMINDCAEWHPKTMCGRIPSLKANLSPVLRAKSQVVHIMISLFTLLPTLRSVWLLGENRNRKQWSCYEPWYLPASSLFLLFMLAAAVSFVIHLATKVNLCPTSVRLWWHRSPSSRLVTCGKRAKTFSEKEVDVGCLQR